MENSHDTPVEPIGHVPAQQARHWPQRLALRCGERSITYEMLQYAIRSVAAALQQSGVGAGDRVAILCENGIAAVVCFYAVSGLGSLPAVINARLSKREINVILDHYDPRLVIYTVEDSPAAAALALDHGAVQRSDELTGTIATASRTSITAAQPAVPSPDKVACLLYTSGTTGQPKGVMLSHRALRAMSRISAAAARIDGNSVLYGVSPIAHIIGLGGNMLGAVEGGAAIELVPRFSTSQLTEVILEERITHLTGVPQIFSALYSHVSKKGIRLDGHRLKVLRCGGAPLTTDLAKRIEEIFGLPLENGYGMTECNSISSTRPGFMTPGSVGRPHVGVEVKIMSSESREARTGMTGEIWVRSPCQMSGYLGDSEATAAISKPDGWLSTGDLGWINEDGDLFVTGRKKELIIRSGFNVMPGEVERVLNTHPMVENSVVVGRDSCDGNQEIIAFAVTDEGCSDEDLTAYCRRQLTGYKRPTRIYIIDHIPFGPNGKVQRRELLNRVIDRRCEHSK